MTEMTNSLRRFGEVKVRLSVELGRAELPLRDVLSLGEGSVVALNRMTDELLDVTANGREIAKGEVIAQDGKFALRIVSLAGDEPRAPAMADEGAQANAPVPDDTLPDAPS